MTKWTRRDVLKSSVVAAAGAGAPAIAASQQGAQGFTRRPTPRERLLLDFGWRFELGNACDPERDFEFGHASAFAKSRGFFEPSRPGFDDSQWQAIDLPHDWAVALPFVRTGKREIVTLGSKPLGRVFPETSIGWYRRVFDVPAEDSGRRIVLEFDGVFRDCTVALNAHYIGGHTDGYAPFRFDVTDFVNYGGKNVLVIRVDATQNEGWFYEGTGIYRHVWLLKTMPVHVANGGTFVRSDVQSGRTTLTISTEVENQSGARVNCRVVSQILTAEGSSVGKLTSQFAQVEAWNTGTFKQRVVLNKPALWSIDSPNLYRLRTRLDVDGELADEHDTWFGIRTIQFDANNGCLLNGQPLKILGTCNHQDHAGVGSALPDRLQYFRIQKLKEMGANAYRTSHNAPTPELMDACDRLGMLVLDETRTMSSAPEALADLEALVRRDRNRPSVFMWSLGNEEPDQGTELGARIVTTMKRLVHRLDPTRPVTLAMNYGYGGKGASRVVDVMGFNYSESAIDGYHERNPQQPMIGAETASTVSTRGIYANDPAKGYVSAYDVNKPRWGSTAEAWWKFYAARAFLAGGFAWTGFDYRGEPTPYGWPCISSHFGIMDTCGFPKDNFYYYQAWWSGKPVLHVFPHWNWEEGQEVDVWCYTNQDRVELFVNGVSQGAKDVERNGHLEWKVKFAPGVLDAVGYRDGKQTLVAKRYTTGAPAAIALRPDRAWINADGEDVVVAAVSVVDGQGHIVPTASNLITFEVTGPGRIIGVGNGDPSCHEPDKASQRSAFNGLAVAIVQAAKQPGVIQLMAASPGLAPASVEVECRQATLRPVA